MKYTFLLTYVVRSELCLVACRILFPAVCISQLSCGCVVVIQFEQLPSLLFKDRLHDDDEGKNCGFV